MESRTGGTVWSAGAILLLGAIALACSRSPSAHGTPSGTPDGGAGDTLAPSSDASDAHDTSVLTDAGVIADGGQEAGPLVNPVATSEKDSTLAGGDLDKNGIRDDLDRYLETLEADPTKLAALKAFAREQTQMMLLGASSSPTQAAATGQQVRVVKTIDCLAVSYGRDQRRALVRTIGAALFNNALRWRAYLTADKLLSGTILPPPSKGCDPAIVGGAP